MEKSFEKLKRKTANASNWIDINEKFYAKQYLYIWTTFDKGTDASIAKYAKQL